MANDQTIHHSNKFHFQVFEVIGPRFRPFDLLIDMVIVIDFLKFGVYEKGLFHSIFKLVSFDLVGFLRQC